MNIDFFFPSHLKLNLVFFLWPNLAFEFDTTDLHLYLLILFLTKTNKNYLKKTFLVFNIKKIKRGFQLLWVAGTGWHGVIAFRIFTPLLN
jgi:hypothetical protein